MNTLSDCGLDKSLLGTEQKNSTNLLQTVAKLQGMQTCPNCARLMSFVREAQHSECGSHDVWECKICHIFATTKTDTSGGPTFCPNTSLFSPAC